MANAQWVVRFQMTDETGDWTAALYLASPDLRDTREAKRRAKITATERQRRKLTKIYGTRRKIDLCVISVECVG